MRSTTMQINKKGIKDNSIEVQELRKVLTIMAKTELSYVCRIADEFNNTKVENESQLSRSPITVVMSPFAHSDLIGDKERHEVVKWMYKVVDHYVFDRETVTIAMSYFDRMLWKAASYNTVPPCHELLAVTSVYLAVKLFETMAVKRSCLLRDLVLMSRRKFNKEKIIAMEAEILSGLSWHVHPTTPQLFSFYFLKFLSRNINSRSKHYLRTNDVPTHDECPQIERGDIDSSLRKVLEMANFLIELSLFDSSLVEEKPSIIAGAAILIALKGIDSNTTNGCEKSASSHIDQHSTTCTCSAVQKKFMVDTFIKMCNGGITSMAGTYDIIPIFEMDLFSVEHKLNMFLQNYTATLGDIQASLVSSSF